MLAHCSFEESATSTKEQGVPSKDSLILILRDIIANMSRSVAWSKQAADIQSTNLDFISLTHLLCDPLNSVITTKDNQPWHLLNKVSITTSMVPMVVGGQ